MAPVCSAFWMGGRIIHVYLRKDSAIFIYQGNCSSRQVVKLSQLGLSCGIKYKTLNKDGRNWHKVSIFISFCAEPVHLPYKLSTTFLICLEIHLIFSFKNQLQLNNNDCNKTKFKWKRTSLTLLSKIFTKPQFYCKIHVLWNLTTF